MPLPSAPRLELVLPEYSLESRFSGFRSVRWRINLGMLPSSPSSSIEDLRRVAANSRRRYAGLRRCLLVFPQFTENGNEAPDLVMDNPLSQNPDSMWGRFFRNAELEKMVDQDLSRLHPEHGSYLQTPECQAMLRRVLLLWCLTHPEHGYKQGMHELLAPFLYVLHVDVCHLSHLRELYEDYFDDKFNDVSFEELSPVSIHNFTVTKSSVSKKWGMINDRNNFQANTAKVGSLDELDTDERTIVLLNDAYGAEGELGVLLSERFMEHDAYCMFDALMTGAHGAVALVDYFSSLPAVGSTTGLPPVIEASSALYHLLSVADASLHSHLVELGVEPQYFSLRWLRLLFGREFLLKDLLIIWDEIFASSNNKSLLGPENDTQSDHRVVSSPQGVFISAIAVSMLLHVRSSLLAAENATSCLQRLLNFPENVDVIKLIEKAKSLQALAFDSHSISPSPSPGPFDRSKSVILRGAYSPMSGSSSPTTPLNLLPESYWEEKWREFHEAKELKQRSPRNLSLSRVEGSTEKGTLSLARTESAPSSTERKGKPQISVIRRLLEDFEKLGRNRVSRVKNSIPLSTDVEAEKGFVGNESEQKNTQENFTEQVCLSGPAANEASSDFFTPTSPNKYTDHEDEVEKSSVASNLSANEWHEETNNTEEEAFLSGHANEENSDFSTPTSPRKYIDHENEVEKSSDASNLFANEWHEETNNTEEPQPCGAISNDQPIPDCKQVEVPTKRLGSNMGGTGKQMMFLKDRKLLPGKFQWLWKFGRSNCEGTSDKGGNVETQRLADARNNCTESSCSSTADGWSNPAFNGVGNRTDKNSMGSLKHLGQSMFENIQVLELAFQQDCIHDGSLENLSRNMLGEGHVAAIAALKELRRISNCLSEI